ncbi:MAG: hypothetical protein LIP77_00295 [Planctomycetes bacterium]|nr:hypothetical protein [Planctomycetota bacterium]
MPEYVNARAMNKPARPTETNGYKDTRTDTPAEAAYRDTVEAEEHLKKRHESSVLNFSEEPVTTGEKASREIKEKADGMEGAMVEGAQSLGHAILEGAEDLGATVKREYDTARAFARRKI